MSIFPCKSLLLRLIGSLIDFFGHFSFLFRVQFEYIALSASEFILARWVENVKSTQTILYHVPLTHGFWGMCVSERARQ